MTRLTTCCPNCGHSSRVGDRYPWLGGLSGQQLEIMLALLDKPGMWFSSETLVRLLYAGKIEPEYADKNLNVLVYRIRKRLGNVIESKWGFGYRIQLDEAGELINFDVPQTRKKRYA